MSKSEFNPHEMPEIKICDDVPDGQVRCPFPHPIKPYEACNKLLFNGRASPEAQEFKCANCGKIVVQRKGGVTVFKRIK